MAARLAATAVCFCRAWCAGFCGAVAVFWGADVLCAGDVFESARGGLPRKPSVHATIHVRARWYRRDYRHGPRIPASFHCRPCRSVRAVHSIVSAAGGDRACPLDLPAALDGWQPDGFRAVFYSYCGVSASCCRRCRAVLRGVPPQWLRLGGARAACRSGLVAGARQRRKQANWQRFGGQWGGGSTRDVCDRAGYVPGRPREGWLCWGQVGVVGLVWGVHELPGVRRGGVGVSALVFLSGCHAWYHDSFQSDQHSGSRSCAFANMGLLIDDLVVLVDFCRRVSLEKVAWQTVDNSRDCIYQASSLLNRSSLMVACPRWSSGVGVPGCRSERWFEMEISIGRNWVDSDVQIGKSNASSV